MITTKDCRKIFFILVPLMLFAFHIWQSAVAANDHKRRESRYERYESRKELYDYNDLQRRQVEKADEGNEVTGQTAAWLLVAANLTVALSILVKGVTRYFPLETETISAIKKFNQLQKKHLMRFHYVLNPLALCIAIFHFLLSSCRKSFLPEWGLILMFLMVVLGLMLKFKASPKRIQRFVYRLHTGLATFSIMIILLIVGHLIVD